ncbi:MAG: hypothetical protein D6785_00890 [Planctomycetota bacterium]|nr:MAG: hypothetical protein D6785_00890 [Planctomycetota bacterium]
MGPRVEAKILKSKDLVLRKINIMKWTSPVAEQYKIESIPHFMIFDPKGKLVKQGFSIYKEILKWKDSLKEKEGKEEKENQGKEGAQEDGWLKPR